MMKKIKKLILVLMSFALMISLTGCLNKNIRNLSDSEIIKQIQAKMKEEMNKINFEVDFEDYEFKVNTGVEIQSNFGKVTIKDKRYNYDPITIYDGNFEVLDKEKIGTNPIIFVAHGYQDYVVNNIFNNEELGNNLDEALRVSGGELPSARTSDLSSNDVLSLDYPVRERLEKEWRDAEFKGSILFFEAYTKQDKQQYLSHFKNQKTKDFNYNDFYKKINFLTVVDILIRDKNIVGEMEMKVQKMYNPSYLLIRITEKQ